MAVLARFAPPPHDNTYICKREDVLCLLRSTFFSIFTEGQTPKKNRSLSTLGDFLSKQATSKKKKKAEGAISFSGLFFVICSIAHVSYETTFLFSRTHKKKRGGPFFHPCHIPSHQYHSHICVYVRLLRHLIKSDKLCNACYDMLDWSCRCAPPCRRREWREATPARASTLPPQASWRTTWTTARSNKQAASSDDKSPS